tara:strand:+ start:1012 stop:1380 length:369 start_codon:yes stop_codon:yes gene_type:complete
MKKILFILFFIATPEVFASDVEMNFTKDAFINAQKSGKTVVVNSWNKWCYTCVKQEKVFKQARDDFKEVVFFSYAQKNKNIADYLNIDYRSTIVVYKNNKEILRAVGITKKEEIYSLIKKGI